jgi:hypothetical protein
MRTRRAFKLRTDCGEIVLGGSGATGISSERLVERGKLRRVASRMPPALMFKAVANSRNSFPSWSTPRTNTGIDKGRRWCFRRSDPDLLIQRFPCHLRAYQGPNTEIGAFHVENMDNNFGSSYLQQKNGSLQGEMAGHQSRKCGNLLRLARKLLAPIIDLTHVFS